jgi:hypothetical protein
VQRQDGTRHAPARLMQGQSLQHVRLAIEIDFAHLNSLFSMSLSVETGRETQTMQLYFLIN